MPSRCANAPFAHQIDSRHRNAVPPDRQHRAFSVGDAGTGACAFMGEMNQMRGLLPLLMKQRNGYRWTELEIFPCDDVVCVSACRTAHGKQCIAKCAQADRKQAAHPGHLLRMACQRNADTVGFDQGKRRCRRFVSAGSDPAYFSLRRRIRPSCATVATSAPS